MHRMGIGVSNLGDVAGQESMHDGAEQAGRTTEDVTKEARIRLRLRLGSNGLRCAGDNGEREKSERQKPAQLLHKSLEARVAKGRATTRTNMWAATQIHRAAATCLKAIRVRARRER